MDIYCILQTKYDNNILLCLTDNEYLIKSIIE